MRRDPRLLLSVLLLAAAAGAIACRRSSASTAKAKRTDAQPAAQLVLQDPMGLASDAAGNVILADRGRGPSGRVLWRIDAAGKAHRIAGTGREGIPIDGAPALGSDLGSPEALTIDARGLVVFVDHQNHMVLRIEPDGTLLRLAGTGRPGFSGDGGPAITAQLRGPYDVKSDSRGRLYVADTMNHRIRRVEPDGTIMTVAGSGKAGRSGDGGPATAAQLDTPYNVLVDDQDRLWIADSGNEVVRLVDRDGTIHTVAGSGRRGASGDGASALEADFDSPQALAVDGKARIAIGDEHNNAVRVLEPAGTLTALLGDGTPGFAPDGTPAKRARLNDPESLLFLPDGRLLVSDGDNHRVLALGPDGVVRNFAGIGPTESNPAVVREHR